MTVVIDTISQPRPRHPEKANRPDSAVVRKPDWIRVKAPVSQGYAETQAIVRENRLVTVCEEAGCPNIGECWEKKHATFMIMGDTCTRACAFCNVKTGLPGALDRDEPEHVGAGRRQARPGACRHHLGRPRRSRRRRRASISRRPFARSATRCPTTTIEILTPDFLRKDGALELVVAAKPDVFNHNLETVPSRYLTVRPGARYFHSIRLLQRVKELDPTMFTKSGHHGRPRRGAERSAAGDGRSALADVDFLTIGQYLQPTRKHHPVMRFVHAGRIQGATRRSPTPRAS